MGYPRCLLSCLVLFQVPDEVSACFHRPGKAMLLGWNMLRAVGTAQGEENKTIQATMAVWANTRSSTKHGLFQQRQEPPCRLFLFPSQQPTLSEDGKGLRLECAVSGNVELVLNEKASLEYRQKFIQDRWMQYHPKTGKEQPRPVEILLTHEVTL